MNRHYFLLVWLSLIWRASAIAPTIGCRDESGKLVDWYYLYKLPNAYEEESASVDQKETGLNYAFITPSSMDQWTLSEHLINESSSMAAQTLSLVYGRTGSEQNLVMMYNDEPPQGATDGSRGHTKGVVVANDINGYWLIHSVPKYPPSANDAYGYPKSGTIYGQSFLCLSLTGDQMAKVGKQLLFNEPHFYSSIIPDYLKKIYPELEKASEMKTVATAPYNNLETLRTRGGTEFLSFAKSNKFKKELYEDWVAPYFAAGDFYVETWRHGPGNIKSDCTKQSKVYNIEEISFKPIDISFKTMKDHSKWMVSEKKKLVCVGDINRQEHQKVRGGGTVCQLSKASIAYGQLIKSVEACERSFLDIFGIISIEK